MEDTGQEEWMNFVLEASGVTETVEKLRKAEKDEEEKERMRDFTDKDGKPLYFSKENATQIYGEYEAGKLDLLDGFYKSLSAEQVSPGVRMSTTLLGLGPNKRIHYFI